MRWAEKSRSNTDVVWAQMRGDEETGKYRYQFLDSGVVIEVGEDGLNDESVPAKRPRNRKVIAAIAVPTALVVADAVWRLVG